MALPVSASLYPHTPDPSGLAVSPSTPRALPELSEVLPYTAEPLVFLTLSRNAVNEVPMLTFPAL